MNRRDFLKTGSGIVLSTVPGFASLDEEFLSEFVGEETPRKAYEKIKITDIKKEEKPKIEIATIRKDYTPDFPILKENNNMSREHFFLDLVNVHTGEKLSLDLANPSRVHYFNELKRFSYFMRDYRTGSVKNVDPNLLNILHNIKVKTGTKKPFLVLSGYRTKKTNNMLRREGHKAALHSLHIQAKAIDITLQDRSVREIANVARGLKMGGVGEYKNNHFVHVDTGRVRQWFG